MFNNFGRRDSNVDEGSVSLGVGDAAGVVDEGMTNVHRQSRSGASNSFNLIIIYTPSNGAYHLVVDVVPTLSCKCAPTPT